ncbi:MAG: hypothetical protein ABIR29_11230 [Chthoniobacterales bacterium]
MTPSDQTPRQTKGESMLAFAIMFFSVALLCFMLGWADGVRRGHAYLHFPAINGWMITTAILVALGAILLVWSRAVRRA